MAKYNPCFLTVIGDNLMNGHPVFPGVIETNFPDYEICNPNSLEDITNTLSNMANKAYQSNAVALLLIKGHGNKNLEKIKFEKCIIETKQIIVHLKHIKNVFPEFKCNVIIQTLQPNHPVIKAISNSKKEEFLKWEIGQRKNSNQPPFSSLIAIIVSGTSNIHVEKESVKLANVIKKRFSHINIYGPAPALLNKIRKNYRWRILIKIDKGDSFRDKLKTFLLNIVSPRDINFKVDVDPLTFF